MNKIKRSDGTTIELQSDGRIWVTDSKSVSSYSGYIINHIANVYPVVGEGFEKYLAVDSGILKYAKKFHIRKLRMTITSYENTDVGHIIKVEYGWIDRSKFKSLLDKRKTKRAHVANMVLLKKEDFKVKDK